MKQMISGLALLCLMGVQACGPGTCIDPSKLTYRIQRAEGQLTRGDKATIHLKVINRSDQYMLIEGVRGAHLAPGGPDALVVAEAGSLESDGSGGYRHNMVAQQMTPAVFGYGLIPPGQHLPVRIDIIPQAAEGEFVLAYWGLTLEQAAQFLLFSDGKEAQSRHYVRWTADGLRQASEPANEKGLRSPRVGTVILGPELAREPPACSVDMPYKLKLSD